MPSPPRSSDHLALGSAVRELRTRTGVSQEQLGFRCELHRNYVGAVERGELNPTYGVLLRLCSGLSVALSELVGLAEQRGAGSSIDSVLLRSELHGSRHRSGHRRAVAHRPAGRGIGAGARRARLLPLWNGQLPLEAPAQAGAR